MSKDIIRCPECGNGKLNKIHIQKRRNWKSFTVKICDLCKIIIDQKNEFRYYNGTSIVS